MEAQTSQLWPALWPIAHYQGNTGAVAGPPDFTIKVIETNSEKLEGVLSVA